MSDKILQVKKEMKRIVKTKGLTRFERYDLLECKTKALNEREMKILIDECKRDYETYNRSKDMTRLITDSLTGIGVLIAAVGICSNRIPELIQDELVLFTYIIICVSLVVIPLLHIYGSGNMNATRYMMDILEEQYKDRFMNHQK